MTTNLKAQDAAEVFWTMTTERTPAMTTETTPDGVRRIDANAVRTSDWLWHDGRARIVAGAGHDLLSSDGMVYRRTRITFADGSYLSTQHSVGVFLIPLSERARFIPTRPGECAPLLANTIPAGELEEGDVIVSPAQWGRTTVHTAYARVTRVTEDEQDRFVLITARDIGSHDVVSTCAPIGHRIDVFRVPE